MKYLLEFEEFIESFDTTDPEIQEYIKKNKKKIKKTGAGAMSQSYTKPTNRSSSKNIPVIKDPSLDKNWY